jgi:cAMP phosphodiesterase
MSAYAAERQFWRPAFLLLHGPILSALITHARLDHLGGWSVGSQALRGCVALSSKQREQEESFLGTY